MKFYVFYVLEWNVIQTDALHLRVSDLRERQSVRAEDHKSPLPRNTIRTDDLLLHLTFADPLVLCGQNVDIKVLFLLGVDLLGPLLLQVLLDDDGGHIGQLSHDMRESPPKVNCTVEFTTVIAKIHDLSTSLAVFNRFSFLLISPSSGDRAGGQC